MDKKYLYRKHLRQPAKLFGCICGIFLLLYVAMTSTILLSNGDLGDSEEIAIFAVVGVFVAILILFEFLILYFAVFRRFKKISVELTNEAIIYNNIKGTTVIPYNEITEVKFPSIRYLGGWVKIMHGNKNIKITVVLEDIGDLLINLKEKLDSIGRENVYKENKFFNFYKTAKYSDNSWARVYEYLKKLTVFVVCNLIVGCILAKLSDDAGVKFMLVILSYILPIVVFVICEIILGRNIAKNSNRENFYVPNRDKALEAKVYIRAYIIYSIIYVIGAVGLLIA